MFGCLDDFVKLNNIRMTNEFENVDLSGDSFDIGYINYPIFLQDFYCNFLSCGNVCS